MRRGLLLLFWLLVWASSADAQVLHEKVSVGNLTCAGGLCSTETGVKAIEQDGQVLFQPAAGAQPLPGEQVFSPQPTKPVEVGGGGGQAGGGDRPPDRRDIVGSDRDTGPEPPGTHYYHAVFNPEIFPYKRMTALDGVEVRPCADGRPGCDDEVLKVQDRSLQILPVVGGRREPGRDAFWGSIVIDLEPSRWVPIPSVAPDTRVLDYKTEPRVEVEFARDGADNLFVRSPSGGRHRLTWLSDAPQRYFGGDLPRARLSDEPAALLRPVPERLRRRVRELLAKAGVHYTKSSTLESVLLPLVNYFRAFDVGALPAPGLSTYSDIAMQQKGVCRHRSYAFAITAMAIGIPVRYVENEVHVFVEVYLPGPGWRRINLGGAPLDEQLLGADGKTMYREKGGDPFPRPDAFSKTTAPRPKGMEQLAGAPGSSGGSSTAGGGSGNGNGNPSATANASGTPRYDPNAPPDNATPPRPNAPPRAATALTVELAERSSFRGETVEVSGQLTATGTDGAGLAIEVYLDGPGGARRVGETTTAADGRYRLTVEVPRDLPLGDHHVYARTSGDDRRAPSSTR